ncbi:hypothetical protein ABZ490_23810 [Streptomyces sp. NPDC005811]|uniref:hypothetical protein n=1 Tax=Streptomyces sp. NPDC005811 TaxID=3154565 RepID=UPI0033CE5FE0
MGRAGLEPLLALTGQALPWRPRRLRLCLLTATGRLFVTGHLRIPRLAKHAPDQPHHCRP